MRSYLIDIEGEFPDPEARRYCFIFDAIIAIGSLIGPELFGAGAAGALGAEAAGAGALTAEGFGAGLTAAEIAGGAGAGAAGAGAAGAVIPGALTFGPELGAEAFAAGLTPGEIAGGVGGGALTTGAGAAEAAGGGGLLDFFGFGGGVPGGEIAPGAGGGLPVGGSPITVEPLSGSAVPAGISPSAPAAVGGVPAIPAGIPGSPAATGAFLDTAEYGPGLLSSSFDSASGVSTASGAGTPASGGGLTSGLDKLVGSATGDFLNTKDLGLLAAGGGLGYNLMNRNQPIPGEKQVNQAANSLTATAGAQANKGMQLESFINSGALPPGLAEGLKTATAAAEASIKSTHARSGTSGSSAEAQDIQAAHERAQAASAEMALKLLQQGSSMVGQAVNTESLAAQLYSQIMRDSLAQDEALGKAIGNFAGALAGSGSGGGNSITLRAA